jgi:transcriptional regulator with XRE-family HTH domain
MSHNTTFKEVLRTIKKSNALSMTSAATPAFLSHLRSLRAKSGLTQEQVAEKAEISYKYYQAIEEGRKRDLRLSTLTKLAKAHDLTVSRLLETPARLPSHNRPLQKVSYRSAKTKKTPPKEKKKSA